MTTRIHFNSLLWSLVWLCRESMRSRLRDLLAHVLANLLLQPRCRSGGSDDTVNGLLVLVLPTMMLHGCASSGDSFKALPYQGQSPCKQDKDCLPGLP